MARFRFPIAVALTSFGLVALLVVASGALVTSALANGLWFGGPGGPPWAGGHGFGQGFQLPPQVAGLHDIPAVDRFSHFKGVQVNLTDKDNNPLTVTVTPGRVSTASPTSLTLAANDGSVKTFTLDSNTAIRGHTGSQGSQPTLTTNDQVVVVTVSGSTTPIAVVDVGANGAGPWGPFGH